MISRIHQSIQANTSKSDFFAPGQKLRGFSFKLTTLIFYSVPATYAEQAMTKERYTNQQRVNTDVRRIEQERKKLSGFAQMQVDEDDPSIPEDDRRLNGLWRQLRFFIGDRDEQGNEKDRTEGANFSSVRLMLQDSLQMQDPRDTGRLYLAKVL